MPKKETVTITVADENNKNVTITIVFDGDKDLDINAKFNPALKKDANGNKYVDVASYILNSFKS